MAKKHEFPCPSCTTWITVPAEYAGKKGRCSACKGSIRVPPRSLLKVAREVNGPTVRVVEVAIAADTPEGVRLLALDPFLAWLGEEARTTPITDGQTLQLGWTLLQCRVVERRLVLLAPDLRSSSAAPQAPLPFELQPDLSQAVWTLFEHTQVPASLGAELLIPTLRQAAVVGPRYAELPCVMERTASQGDDDSGWTFNSVRPDVDNNDPEQLARVSLYEAALASPRLLRYLSLPPGFAVLFDPARSPAPIVLRGRTPVQPLSGSYLASTLEAELRA